LNEVLGDTSLRISASITMKLPALLTFASKLEVIVFRIAAVALAMRSVSSPR